MKTVQEWGLQKSLDVAVGVRVMNNQQRKKAESDKIRLTPWLSECHIWAIVVKIMLSENVTCDKDKIRCNKSASQTNMHMELSPAKGHSSDVTYVSKGKKNHNTEIHWARGLRIYRYIHICVYIRSDYPHDSHTLLLALLPSQLSRCSARSPINLTNSGTRTLRSTNLATASNFT